MGFLNSQDCSYDASKYFADSLKLSCSEKDLIKDFSIWLPDEIIDCHAHSGLPEHVLGMDKKTFDHMLSTFPYFSIEASQDLHKIFYPNKKVRALRFAKTFRGIAHKEVNDYLLTNSPTEDRVALFGLPEDIKYTVDMLEHPRVSALKMYYSYVEPTAEHIYEYFIPEILESAQARKKPIILHLPKQSLDCSEDLLRLICDFPELKIVLAHLGPTDYMQEGLRDLFQELSTKKYVYLDTSLNDSSEVIELALEIFGKSKLLYGSDEPLNLVRGKLYVHPEKGSRLITEYPYHWVDPEDYKQFSHLATGVTHWHWGSLLALRTAIDRLPSYDVESAKEHIFSLNAKSVFNF